MSISTSFFHALKTDNRVFYGTVAGLSIGSFLGSYTSLQISKTYPHRDIKKNSLGNLSCLTVSYFAAILACHYESKAFAAVAALGWAGTFWFNRKISLINAAKSEGRARELINRSVKLSYLGSATTLAVPAISLALHALGSMKGMSKVLTTAVENPRFIWPTLAGFLAGTGPLDFHNANALVKVCSYATCFLGGFAISEKSKKLAALAALTWGTAVWSHLQTHESEKDSKYREVLNGLGLMLAGPVVGFVWHAMVFKGDLQ